jgi:hypothetical protein
MSMVKINNKNYEVPELNFAHSKRLEQYGVPLRRLIDPDLMFTIVSAFVAIVTDTDPEMADYIIEQHILGGGNLEDIYKAYVTALSESGFFKKLLESQEKQTKTVKATKTAKEATPNE